MRKLYWNYVYYKPLEKRAHPTVVRKQVSLTPWQNVRTFRILAKCSYVRTWQRNGVEAGHTQHTEIDDPNSVWIQLKSHKSFVAQLTDTVCGRNSFYSIPIDRIMAEVAGTLTLNFTANNV